MSELLGAGPSDTREARSAAAVPDWSELADEVAGHVQDFLTALDAVASGGAGTQAVPLLLLEVSQVHFVGARLGASVDVIPPGNVEPMVAEDPDLDAVRNGLAEQLDEIDYYVEVFDPYGDDAPVAYRLSDDLADIAEDLGHGLRHYRAGRSDEALWWWQFSYLSHWGNHSGAALRALHAVVAHSRLDTTPEPDLDDAEELS
jgi:hypothetical protein